MRCDSCKWWTQMKRSEWIELGIVLGRCRYNPPIPIIIKNVVTLSPVELNTVWAVTRENDFCSKWENRFLILDTKIEEPKKSIFDFLKRKGPH